MPRTPIEIAAKIDYLSILDQAGQIDPKLEPKLTSHQLEQMYRYMLFGRRLDERMLILQRQGRLATFAQCSGHEAISLGAAFAINKEDWFIPYYRELAGMLYRGWTPEKFLLYWNGFEEGASVPEGVNDLPFCVPIASQLLHGVGIAMGMSISEAKNVVLVFFGDGAASEGDCHEAMNYASVFNAPVIFICVNNQYAISVPTHNQMHSATLAQRAIAYDMPGIRVDGNDILAVYAATKEAVERARAGNGPSLIEALTYRLTPHTTADDPKRYRDDKEVEQWQAKDPLPRFKEYLYGKNILSKEKEEKLEGELLAEIKLSVEGAEALAKTDELHDPLRIFDFVQENISVGVKRQRDELEEFLRLKKNSYRAGDS